MGFILGLVSGAVLSFLGSQVIRLRRERKAARWEEAHYAIYLANAEAWREKKKQLEEGLFPIQPMPRPIASEVYYAQLKKRLASDDEI